MKRLLILLILVVTVLSFGVDNFEGSRGSRISWGRLKVLVHGDSQEESNWNWFFHPSGDIRLIGFLRKNTSINILADWNVADVEVLDKMILFPFLFMHGERSEQISENGRKNIAEYMKRGGFLFIDDCVYPRSPQDQFYQSMILLLPKMLPGIEIKRIDMDHELFSYFYKIEVFPHCQGANHGMSLLYYNGDLVGAITASDIHCGWTSEKWFGKPKSIQTLKLATNLFIYAMDN